MAPAAAGANRNVFYTPAGAPRSVADVYDRFADKLGAGSGDTGIGSTVNYAAQSLNLGDSTVITGNNQSAADALTWATSALGKFAAQANPTAAANLMRPTPDTARLAYMMLANLGS